MHVGWSIYLSIGYNLTRFGCTDGRRLGGGIGILLTEEDTVSRYELGQEDECVIGQWSDAYSPGGDDVLLVVGCRGHM